MDDEHQVLKKGHGVSTVDVEDPDNQGHGNDHERALVIRRRVVRISNDGAALNQRADKEWAGRGSGLP